MVTPLNTNKANTNSPKLSSPVLGGFDDSVLSSSISSLLPLFGFSSLSSRPLIAF